MNKITTENKGFITLGEKVMVSDPCYGLGTWCQGVLNNVLSGKYECVMERSDEGDWGNRVSAIEVTHIDYKGKFMCLQCENIDIGVDSGQAGIFDYEYYAKYHTDATERDHVDDDWYDMVCDKTYTDYFDGNTIDNLGFVSSSGYGDGGYCCWVAKNEDDKIICIRVEFITEDEEDDDYDEEDEYENI